VCSPHIIKDRRRQADRAAGQPLGKPGKQGGGDLRQ
jgi:hypothetical protein